MVPVPKRQPRSKPPPYKKTTPKTGLPTTTSKRQNLTLHDWLTVFAYIDAHPDLSQTQVVKFFQTRAQGKLEFTQASLSRKLKARNELEERVHLNPNALSSKRPRIVTRPDVEEALLLWIGSMETKGHAINGPMLRQKRQQFEEQMNVPEAERLVGDGWIASFRKTYAIREHRRHRDGEATQPPRHAKPPQLESVEQDSSVSVANLKSRNRISGEPPTLDELIDPIEERENSDTGAAVFEDDVAIIAEVRRREALRSGDIIEVDSDDDSDDGDSSPDISATELMEICRKLEAGYISRADANTSLDFLHHLRAFRAKLRLEGMKNGKQTTLDRFVKSK